MSISRPSRAEQQKTRRRKCYTYVAMLILVLVGIHYFLYSQADGSVFPDFRRESTSRHDSDSRISHGSSDHGNVEIRTKRLAGATKWKTFRPR